MTETPSAAVPALAIEDLSVSYRVRGRDRQVVHGISFAIAPGEAFGLVGESGCGKSTVAYATMGYLPRNGRVAGGRIEVAGQDVAGLRGEALRRLRASAVSMVYQDPGRALNPSLRIGRQMAEVYEPQGRIGRAEALDRATDMLRRVQIADPGRVLDRYPHELSGGMQQRVCIAMALAINPSLLILDEPTTGLDATVEAEVLDLVRRLRAEFNTAILCISHNLGVIATLCERVGVLYAGTLVEQGAAADLFARPRHPYTVGLLRCLPQRGRRKAAGPLETIPGFLPLPDQAIQGCVFAERCPLATDVCRTNAPPMRDLGGRHGSRCHFWERAADLPRGEPVPPSAPHEAPARPLLRVRGLSKTFHLKRHSLRAVQDVSFDLGAGETLGLVGESGSGKTTLARMLLGLMAPDRDGSLMLDGRPLAGLLAERSPADGKALQIVFQNPDSALNRAHPVRRIIGRAIAKLTGLHGGARDRRLAELATAVRLPERTLGARPRQLSGGLKQRVAIARAFAGEPRLVVCDEPTSALDVSVQAAILNLFVELQAKRQVSYIFISHDLGVVRFLADRIAVLYLGRLMEIGPAEQVFAGPHHPYTEALLSAVPAIDGQRQDRIRLRGEMPSASNPPAGCVFVTRCARRLGGLCETVEPPLTAAGEGHAIRCHIPAAELAGLQSTVPAEAGAGQASAARI